MTTRILGLLLGLTALGLAGNSTAQDAAAGEAKAAACMACHGPAGRSANTDWPNLAGQHADYTARQLALFKNGQRVNALMSGMAMPLSDQDMADISAYYAAQVPAQGSADENLVDLAQALYTGGDKERGIPACIACHGASGQGNPAAGYPMLSGQMAGYTKSILEQFKSGGSWDGGDLVAQVMVDIAGRLSDEEIAALASYMQGLGGR